MGSSEKICMVSFKIGSVEEEEADPLDDFFLVDVLEILDAIVECMKNT